MPRAPSTALLRDDRSEGGEADEHVNSRESGAGKKPDAHARARAQAEEEAECGRAQREIAAAGVKAGRRRRDEMKNHVQVEWRLPHRRVLSKEKPPRSRFSRRLSEAAMLLPASVFPRTQTMRI